MNLLLFLLLIINKYGVMGLCLELPLYGPLTSGEAQDFFPLDLYTVIKCTNCPASKEVRRFEKPDIQSASQNDHSQMSRRFEGVA